MAVSYAVQAVVVDIRADKPQPTDAFLVDTQVWLWIVYTRASLAVQPPAPYQLTEYPSYFRRALAARAKFWCCGLALAELAHRIERTELEFFLSAAKGATSPKEYRHNHAAERRRVIAEIQAAWGAVKAIASPLDVTIDTSLVDSVLNRFHSQALDGYDLFYLEAMAKAGLTQVLTDDGDYCTVPNVCVFTANANVVSLAKAQGKLLVR